MKRLTLLCLLFLITGVSVGSNVTEYKHEDREPTKLEKQTFDILKKKFRGELLDENLETLHLLSDSAEYVNFLSKRYPEHAPFTAFQDFYYTVLPPKEHYFKFFKQQFGVQTIGEIDVDELFLVHAYASDSWTFWGYKRGGDKSPHLRGLPQRFAMPLLVNTPKGRKMLERRLGIASHQNIDFGRILPTFSPLHILGSAHREEDFRWIKNLFKKHGQSDGMLWLVVQDPILLDRILYTFSTDKTFLKSVFDPLELDIDKPRENEFDKPREMEKPSSN